MDDFRSRTRERWARSAAGWAARGDAFSAATMPVSTWLVDALEPQPGQTILELAAGTGDTGFLAAELVQPGGTVICSDFSPEMLTAAQERARRLGVRNVRFRQIDLEAPLDQPAASLDGVLCRWGYMLLADPEAALRETRRVLRPGARVALAAWRGPEVNRWSSLAGAEIVARGLAPPLAPGEPGQFAWAAEGIVADQLEGAAFEDVEVEAIDFTMAFASPAEWWEHLESTSMRFADAMAGLDAGGRGALERALRAALAPTEVAPDGSLRFLASTWVARASAP
jgi:SAM-dependent methyltransferase